MSQYALNGIPVPFGSIQYSPFFCALVDLRMSLQETPGNSGDEPFLTDKREETRRTDVKLFPRKKISFLGNLRSLRNKKRTDCGDKHVKQTHIFKLFT